MPGAGQLRGQHGGRPGPRLVLEHRVVEHTGGVDDAAQRRHRGFDGLEHLGQLGPIGDIARRRDHLDTEGAERIQRDLVGGVGCTAAEQDEVAGAVLDEVAGHEQPDPAPTTGDQVGAVGPDRCRWRDGLAHDDLARVTGLGHEAERIDGVGDLEHGGRQRPQGSRLELGDELAEHGLDGRRVGPRDVAEEHDVVVDIGTGDRDPGRVPDVASADLQEATAGRQQLQRPWDELAVQRVQHDVDAGARRSPRARRRRSPASASRRRAPRRGRAGCPASPGCRPSRAPRRRRAGRAGWRPCRRRRPLHGSAPAPRPGGDRARRGSGGR